MSLHFFNPKSKIPQWKCEAKERWLLSAPTGWGKSIWLRQLALLRDANDTELTWNGKKVQCAEAPAFRRKWIYVSQASFRSNDVISDHLTHVFQLKAHGREWTKDPEDFLKQALLELGIEKIDIRKRRLNEISGGESQAISLVRSVLLNPEGLLLDEPTSAMDRPLALKTEAWLNKNFSGAWVWVTHDPTQKERLLQSGAKLILPP